jgi:apolipoprotein N-acyltransferase
MAITLLVAMGVFGAIRLSMQPTKMVANVKLRIMQPNLQQDVKFNYGAKQDVMQKYLALSDRASGPQSTGVRDASILIWPESAFPFFLTREADAMAQIADLLPKGTVLITGAVRVPDDARPGVPVTRAYNSIYLIGAVRRIPAVPELDGAARLQPAYQSDRRIYSRHAPALARYPRRTACATADLL